MTNNPPKSPFSTIFQKVPCCQTMLSPNSEKSGKFSPVRRGGDRTFFRDSACAWWATFERRPWPWRAGAIERGTARAADAKIEKKVVFWHKKCETFRIRHPKKKYQKCFNPPMRPKRHFALKDTFPMETRVKNPRKKSQIFQKFAKSYFQKKIEKKCRSTTGG